MEFIIDTSHSGGSLYNKMSLKIKKNLKYAQILSFSSKSYLVGIIFEWIVDCVSRPYVRSWSGSSKPVTEEILLTQTPQIVDNLIKCNKIFIYKWKHYVIYR